MTLGKGFPADGVAYAAQALGEELWALPRLYSAGRSGVVFFAMILNPYQNRVPLLLTCSAPPSS